MQNDLITITVERMSNGKKLRSSTTLPMSIFDLAAESPGFVFWGEIIFLMSDLDEKEKAMSARPRV